MRRISTLLALTLALTLPAAAAGSPFGDRVPLPNGFAPEGIATGQGSTFYSGSLAGAGIWRGDYRTGEGGLLVDGGGPFVGMKVDARNRLWVAGGPLGTGYVFDAASGAPITDFTFAAAPTFINDVVVTDDAAYFTDSMQAAIYRVPIGPDGEIGGPDVIPLDPADIGFVEGEFNLNGIEASADGNTLIAVNSTAGALYAIDPASESAEEIALGGASVGNGDGILLLGRTLFVVRNQLNLVAVVSLAPDLLSGIVVDELTSDNLNVPTTVARFGSSIYAVNARFGTPVTPDTEYWVTKLDR
jgi:sugar lactone lactonase YvrE